MANVTGSSTTVTSFDSSGSPNRGGSSSSSSTPTPVVIDSSNQQGWGAVKGEAPAATTYGGAPSSGGTYTSIVKDASGNYYPVSREQAIQQGSIDSPTTFAEQAQQIGLTPQMAEAQYRGSGSELATSILRMKEENIPQIQSQSNLKVQMLQSPTTQWASKEQFEKTASETRAPAGTQFRGTLVVPTIEKEIPPVSKMGFDFGMPKMPSISSNINTKGGTISIPAAFIQSVEEQKNLAEYEKYSNLDKFIVGIGISPSKYFDKLLSESKYTAGKDIVRIPASLVGGEKDWVLRVSTPAEAQKAYATEKSQTIQELKDIQNSKDTPILGIIPLTGEGAKAYRALTFGATTAPSELYQAYAGGKLLGMAIPMAGSLSRIGAGKITESLAAAETKNAIGLGASKWFTENIVSQAVAHAEPLINIAGGLYVASEIKQAGQKEGGITAGTGAYEAAKLGLAFKGFKETYEPTLKSLKGVETVSELAKTAKPLNIVEKSIVGKAEWSGEAPSSPFKSTGRSLSAIDKEIAGQSRWTGGIGGKEGQAPSNYPAPSKFGFSDLGGKVKIVDVTPKSGAVRGSSGYEYGNPIENIGNPFEGFGEIGSAVGKTVIGFGRGVAERGELPVPAYGAGGQVKSYQNSEITVDENSFVLPVEYKTPKIDKFGSLISNKQEVGIGTGLYTGTEVGNRFIDNLVNPNKNINATPTVNENPFINREENINRNETVYKYEPRFGYPPPELFFPPLRGGGGGGGGGEGRVPRKSYFAKTRASPIFSGDPFKGAFDNVSLRPAGRPQAKRTMAKPTTQPAFDFGFKVAGNPIVGTTRKAQERRIPSKPTKSPRKVETFDLGFGNVAEKSKKVNKNEFWRA